MGNMGGGGPGGFGGGGANGMSAGGVGSTMGGGGWHPGRRWRSKVAAGHN